MGFQVRQDIIDAANKQQADAAAAEKQRKADLMTKQQSETGYTGPGYQAYTPSEYEQKAGINPPGFRGVTDVKTGQLIDQYKINPFLGEASQKLRQEALGTGPSPWASMALQRQGLEESQARGAAGHQQQMAQSQAMSQLARQGGLGSGARTSLARSGARDQMMAAQGVGQQGAMARYGINEADAQRRQQLLGSTADIERAGDVQNQATMMKELEAKARFEANRYNQQMGAWGAEQTANATRSAGGGGGGKK